MIDCTRSRLSCRAASARLRAVTSCTWTIRYSGRSSASRTSDTDTSETRCSPSARSRRCSTSYPGTSPASIHGTYRASVSDPSPGTTISASSRPTSSSADAPISSHRARLTRRKQPARSCSMLTSAMPIGACSKAPRKRSSASCTIASARRRSLTSRSTAVVKWSSPSLQREKAASSGISSPSAPRPVVETTVCSPSSSCGAGLSSSCSSGAPTTSPAGRPKICWAAMFTYATLPCSSTETIASAAEAATARKCFSLRRSSSSACLRPIRVPTWAATADTRATRRSSSSRCSNTKNSITATTSSSAMTGTATPPARPTACANSPRSKPGSERTSRIQTARALSQALPGRPIPGTNDSASVTRRNEDRPAVAACQAGLHTSVRPSGLSTHAWPIAQPVRSHTPRKTSSRARSAESAPATASARSWASASSSSARRRSVTSRPML